MIAFLPCILGILTGICNIWSNHRRRRAATPEYEKRRKAQDRFLILTALLSAGFLFGYNATVVGGFMDLAVWQRIFSQFEIDNVPPALRSKHLTLEGVIFSIFTIGALVASLTVQFYANKLGPRTTMFLGATCTLVGGVLQATSFHLAQLIVGRFIVGYGVGILSVIVPIWMSECSHPSGRGRNTVLFGSFVSMGFMCAAWVNYACLSFVGHRLEEFAFRIPLAVPCLVSIYFMVMLSFLPTTPYWLLEDKRPEEAKKLLKRLRGSPDPSDAAPESEPQRREEDLRKTQLCIQEIDADFKKIQAKTQEAKPSLASIFRPSNNMLQTRFWICCGVQFAQQMCGSNFVSVYSLHIFKHSLGLDARTAGLLYAGANSFKFCSSFIAFFTIERFGRRKLFMVSGYGMGLCLLGVAIATSFTPSTAKDGPKWENEANSTANAFMNATANALGTSAMGTAGNLPGKEPITLNIGANAAAVAFIFLFNLFNPIGFLGNNFVYTSELAPSELRLAMTSISTGNHWVWNELIITVSPFALQAIGWKYYILFIVICFGISTVAAFCFPETKGKSIEEIDDLFKEHDTLWGVVKASLKPVRVQTEDKEAGAADSDGHGSVQATDSNTSSKPEEQQVDSAPKA